MLSLFIVCKTAATTVVTTTVVTVLGCHIKIIMICFYTVHYCIPHAKTDYHT